MACTLMNLSPKVAREIIESSTEAVVLVDGDGKIVFVNRPAEELFGYEAGELPGQTIEILMPEAMRQDHARHRSLYARAPHARPLFSGLALKGRRKDGGVFDAEIALTPIETEHGMLLASAVRQIGAGDTSEPFFRQLLDSAPDAMIIVDEEGRITIANDQSVRMFGYARDELIGKPVEMLLPEASKRRHAEHRRAYRKNPHVRAMGTGMELAGRRADGTEFPVEISLSPVSIGAGMFVSSVIRDVSERKRMEQELIAARQAAERANKANTAFLAAASHDLRQPVQALTLLNGALRRTVSDPLAKEMVDSQQESLDAMTNLLNSLLDISRLDAGAVQPDIEEFAIQRLVDRLSAEFSRQARHKGLTFNADNCGTVVRSDPNLLAEIIQNLVSNAIRYTDKGGVSLGCAAGDGYLRIEVQDSGIGIEADQLEEIFREFHQIKMPGSRKEGFGLGLAIVRRLADLLGHEVTVTSTPGQGSCFAVRLPIVARDARIATTGIEGGDKTPAPGGLIILIEDDVKIANAWGLLLEAEGYRVATAASATEARALVRHVDIVPDLIISDFHLLDGSTGVTAVTEIRRLFERNIPAFIVSGDTSKVVHDARALANSALMSKPVNTDRLLRMTKVAIATGDVPQD